MPMFPPTSKAYRLYCPKTDKMIVSRDVMFAEDGIVKESAVREDSSTGKKEKEKVSLETSTPTESEEEEEEEEELLRRRSVERQNDEEGGDRQEMNGSERLVEEGRDNDGDSESDHSQDDREDGTVPLRRSTRVRKSPEFFMFQANVVTTEEPTTYHEAITRVDGKHWQAAADDEMKSLTDTGTYELVELPSGRKLVDCKWVFKVKTNADGEIERYKARLVAKGFSQVEGIDYTETFAPVAKYGSIRCVLAIAAQLDLEIHQMDVKTAFLNGELEEEIYMRQPPGYTSEQTKDKVWKLKKGLYGLKQAPRMWWIKLDSYLQSIGFTRGTADHSIYVQRSDQELVILTVYVDDLLIISNKMSAVERTKRELKRKFEMSDMGEAHYILGIRITRDRAMRKVYLSQEKYVKNILKKFGMEDCKPISTPLEVNQGLSKSMSPQTARDREYMATIPYRQAVGSLMHAMIGTRLDICYAVGAVSQFMSDPGKEHWTAVKRILRYLQGTQDYQLELSGSDNSTTVVLHGYCDADWGSNPDNRRSVSGYAFSLGRGTINWSSKRQPTTALSSTEAEYMASTHATKEAIWLRSLLKDFGFEQVGATIINTDSQGSLALAKNPTHHSRTKHIDIQHHFVREQIELQTIELQYCPTEEMTADVLTKPLARIKHSKCTYALGLDKC